MDKTKDLTPLLARRSRRAELLGQLPVARQAVADAEAELAAAGEGTAEIEHDRRLVRLAERRATLAAIYQGLAGLVRSASYRAACEDAASALQDQAAEAMALLIAYDTVTGGLAGGGQR